MNTHLRPGLRKLPSDINLDILESVSLLAENLPEGDITLSAPLTSTPLQAILNGSFEENLGGWNTRGSTQLINEQVQLDENDALHLDVRCDYCVSGGISIRKLRRA